MNTNTIIENDPTTWDPIEQLCTFFRMRERIPEEFFVKYPDIQVIWNSYPYAYVLARLVSDVTFNLEEEGDHISLFHAAYACVEEMFKHTPESLRYIKARFLFNKVKDYMNGKVTEEEVYKARNVIFPDNITENHNQVDAAVFELSYLKGWPVVAIFTVGEALSEKELKVYKTEDEAHKALADIVRKHLTCPTYPEVIQALERECDHS